MRATNHGRPRPRVLLTAVFVLLCLPAYVSAQCAGEDGSLEICDYTDPANQFVSLFDLLGGSPETGGTWSFPMPLAALNTTTGVVDIWKIHLSGTYQFTYTVTTAGCADNTAVVSLVIGPFAGVPSPTGAACDDDDSVNLFTFFDTEVGPDPQQNGTWTDNSGTGAQNGNFLDATASGLGTFQFTYTVPAAGNCPASSATIWVTVHRKPEPGTAPEQGYCDTDDFSGLTDIDLQELLSGEDPFGIWTDVNGTGQLFGFFDSHINLQQVVATFGPGEYQYAYTVYPSNPVCQPKTATVRFVIEKHIDYSQATLVVSSDICEDEMEGATYQATLTQGPYPVPDAHYLFVYTISGPADATVSEEGDFSGGVLTFDIDPEHFPLPGDYTVTITQMKDPLSPGYCPNPIDVSDVLHIYPLPDLETATMTIPRVCAGEDAVATLSGSGLADGDYEMTYTLSGANALPQTDITVILAGGGSVITIPKEQLPNVGTTTLTITYIRSVATGCETTSTFTRNIVVETFPDTAPIQVAIQNACAGDGVAAILTGLGSLTDVTITYSLSGANTATGQETVLAPSGGTAAFVIPSGLLPNTGGTTFSLDGVRNNANDCGESAASASKTFTIHENPAAPIASDAVFCSADQPTVAALQPSGSGFRWYESAEATTPLPDTAALVSGDYFVSFTDLATGCISERTSIHVTVVSLPQPQLLPDGASLCGADNPTLETLAENLLLEGDAAWFDAPGGNPLEATTVLSEGETYYAYDADPVSGCRSADGLAITVTLTDCDPGEYDFMIPDGFSPNGDGVNDTFRIPEIEFLFPDFRLEIYNRYGALLFKGDRNRPQWDGRSSETSSVTGGVVPNGVYFYIVYFNRDNQAPKQGRLYLNR